MDRHNFVYFAAGKNKRERARRALIAPTFITILGRGICHSVCARKISAGCLPAVYRAMPAKWFVCRLAGSTTGTWAAPQREREPPTERAKGQFLFSLSTRSPSLSVSSAVASRKITLFAAAAGISTGNDVRLSRLLLFYRCI